MEKLGIPTVEMLYADQANYFKQIALNNGCPNIRYVAVPRIGHAEEIIATYYDKIIKALTDPLTAKEKEAGLYSPSAPPRVLFEGTLLEAQEFLGQTVLVENCRNCPIAKYTDGLPVVIPTEEAVAAMLTGTSHKASEQVVTPYEMPGFFGPATPAGAAITFAQKYTSTVEKVAICAVMAGCKPQYLPVALAIATSGGGTTNCPGTSSMATTLYIVSGPIAKEIGMNAGQNSMDVGNPANMTLGRVGALISVNFGGCITGLVRTDSGNPVHSVCTAEDLEGLPPGWIGFNEESTYMKDGKPVNYTKNQSVVGKGFSWGLASGFFSFPGYYRSMNEGQMGIARYLGVEGKPGYYNWMEAILPIIVRAMPSPSSGFFILHMNLAQMLYLYGFKTKAAVYKWMFDTYFVTVKEYWNSGLYDFMTDGGRMTEPTSGKTYIDLLKTDPGYKLHVFGGFGDPNANCIIVGDSFADEHWYWNIFGFRPSTYAIDPWK